MAHFAELDNENKVIRVIVVANEILKDENGEEQEAKGKEFVENLLGGRWMQTSYNGSFRGRFAGIGFIYDPIKKEFVSLEVPEELA